MRCAPGCQEAVEALQPGQADLLPPEPLDDIHQRAVQLLVELLDRLLDALDLGLLRLRHVLAQAVVALAGAFEPLVQEQDGALPGCQGLRHCLQTSVGKAHGLASGPTL